ncbi:MAG: asparagine synthase (glutamine-hydrolyzing) [Bacteroidia bacterium]|nr:asparagine synthase (glutamine-hydrolyzing) [Bacteroidia bacterium]
MCGITGIYALQPAGNAYFENASKALKTMELRGPDGNGLAKFDKAILGHARLSIIDTSTSASQPFTDESGRYTLVFNGEIFNYQDLKNDLAGTYTFKSTSDTEVLLYQFIENGKDCLSKLNGFFAFAVYDAQEDTLFMARDRYGIKPFLYFLDEGCLIFSSEMKALMAWGIPKVLDDTSLQAYFQFNYIPGPHSVFRQVKKLEPGSFLEIKNNELSTGRYYELKQGSSGQTPSYERAQQQLVELLEDAVQRRLISDVPLGSFLSGGIDSSVVVALASRHTSRLNTFSIGFKDEPLFDETEYANLVARKFGTNHTVFSLTNDDLYANLHAVLDYIDEPFADSSALNVHILSMHTRKHVTVALSGDGADEMLGGYNKHEALRRAAEKNVFNSLLSMSAPFWSALPSSRNGKWSNRIRQLEKYSKALDLDWSERYWQWASFMPEQDARDLLVRTNEVEFEVRKMKLLRHLKAEPGMNAVFKTDMELVLQNDMLVKVDLMSMANSLEVRVPFLDYRVVDFIFSLPDTYKIDASGRKRILRDAFRSVLPQELYTRNKQGFEVPLLKWFRTELKSKITDDYLAPKFIKEQGVFHNDKVQAIVQRMLSNNPGDSATHVWNLLVFQNWWRKYYKQ